MSTDNLTQILTQTVENLPQPESLEKLFHQHRHGASLHSGKNLIEIIGLHALYYSKDFTANTLLTSESLNITALRTPDDGKVCVCPY